MSRVALVTCAELPDLDPDDRRLLRPLGRLGVEPVAAVWDDPEVDWSGFDLAVLRSTWDYPARRSQFVTWAGSVPRLANPGDIVAWNTDKRYLLDLDLAGLPVVPTRWVVPDETWRPAESGEWVVKPAVGAGSFDVGRYQLADPTDRRRAAEHVSRLQHAGQMVLLQPYLQSADRYGETAVIFIASPHGGAPAYSHAIRKGPMLAARSGPREQPEPAEPEPALYRPERISSRVPTVIELAVARRTVAEVPGGPERLLYARVDLIPGRDGRPLVVELELTEPSLFLGYAPGAATLLATAIARRAGAAAG
jgi:hypothetical protein